VNEEAPAVRLPTNDACVFVNASNSRFLFFVFGAPNHLVVDDGEHAVQFDRKDHCLPPCFIVIVIIVRFVVPGLLIAPAAKNIRFRGLVGIGCCSVATRVNFCSVKRRHR